MKALLLAGAALLALVPPVLGSTQSRARTCSVDALNTSGKTLYLKKTASIPKWTPGYRPQPLRVLADHALLYWTTKAGPSGCWSRTVYARGARTVVMTLDGRAGHKRVARCAVTGFIHCRIDAKQTRGPNMRLSVRIF